MGKEYLQPVEVLGEIPLVHRILLYDAGEGVFNWGMDATGGDDVHEVSATHYFEGTKSIHLKTRATGALENDYLRIKKKVTRHFSQRFELSMLFWTDDAEPQKYLDFEIWDQDSADEYRFGIRFEYNTGTGEGDLQYLNSAGTYTEIASLDNLYPDSAWAFIALTVDAATGEYISVNFIGVEYDLSGISGYRQTGGVNFIETRITITASNAPPAEMYYEVILLREV